MDQFYEKKYQDKLFLETMIKEGKTPKQIAAMLNVSYKLINVWLVKYGLITRTPDTKVP